MLRTSAGNWALSDSTKRILVKTISWRVAALISAFAIGYALVGDFAISTGIALAQMVVNTVLYYVHESVWGNIKWGQQILSALSTRPSKNLESPDCKNDCSCS